VRPSPLLRTIVAAIALLALAGCTAKTSTGARPTAGTGTEARLQLDALAVAPARAMTGYSRDRFPHWSDQGGGCNTRDVVLKRDGLNVESTGQCKIIGGTWYSVFDGKTFTDPQDVDIDHFVPLANAWRSGADKWDDARRKDFANDLTRPQLIAVSRASNRAKGDQDPANWKPTNEDYWCEYAARWVAVKYFWQLTVTSAEQRTLKDMLAACA
jgi:hypothetical protein